MRQTKRHIIIVPLFWLAISATGCHPTSDSLSLSLSDYRKSEYSKWISLPAEAHDIIANKFYGRDVNYSFVAFAYSGNKSLTDILNDSLAVNTQHEKNDSEERLSGIKFNIEGFNNLFMHGERAIPPWWISVPHIESCETEVLLWSRNNYGMGYLGIKDPISGEIRILRFSRQWLTMARFVEAFPGRH